METVLMMVWTLVLTGGISLPVTVTQTSTLVPRATCEEVKRISGSEINQPKERPLVDIYVTVKCVPIPK